MNGIVWFSNGNDIFSVKRLKDEKIFSKGNMIQISPLWGKEYIREFKLWDDGDITVRVGDKGKIDWKIDDIKLEKDTSIEDDLYYQLLMHKH